MKSLTLTLFLRLNDRKENVYQTGKIKVIFHLDTEKEKKSMAENVRVLIDHIDRDLLQVNAIDDVAVNGIQVQGKKREIHTIATAVTASLSVIERACRDKVDLLIVHHGIFLKGAVSSIIGALYSKMQLLLDHGITLAAYHLPLDAHPHLGNAWSLPIDMGWKEIEPFCSYKGMCHLGVMATLPENMVAQELAETLVPYFQPIHHRYQIVLPEKKVSRIAFIPGQGHKFIKDAISLGADCFITGTSDEPIWHLSTEEKVAFMSFGHHATERMGVKKMGEYLASRYKVSHIFYDEPNPF